MRFAAIRYALTRRLWQAIYRWTDRRNRRP